MSYRFRVFLVLTGLLVAGWVAWDLLRWETRAGERAAWAAVTDTLRVQQARLDSLEALLGRLDGELGRRKQDLASLRERLAHFERIAPGGTLPTPQHRQYLRAIEDHNRAVAGHNELLAEMNAHYARYSAAVDARNALADSANAMQRRAVQAGYALPGAP